MLRESSMSTAMMSCCGLSRVMRITGCHKRMSSSAASADCSSQIAPARQRRTSGVAVCRRERMIRPRTMVTARIDSHNAQVGHGPSRTSRPLANTSRGYLKSSSNMQAWGIYTLALHVSVGHAVHDVVDAHPEGHRGEGLRILCAVGPLPGIAQM